MKNLNQQILKFDYEQNYDFEIKNKIWILNEKS